MIRERLARPSLHDDAGDQAEHQAYSNQASDAGVCLEEKVVQRTKIQDYLVTLTRPITIATERLHFSVRVYYVGPIRYGSDFDIPLFFTCAEEGQVHARCEQG